MRTFSLLFLMLGTFAGLTQADVIYNVTVDTSSYAGKAGYLDFQLGRGPDSQAVSASVTAFLSNGTLANSDVQVSGAVTGALPNSLVLTNATQYNDYFHGFAYGTSIRFTLVFAGAAVNAPSGTSLSGSPFLFGLYDANQAPLGPNDGFGSALSVEVNTNGTTTPTVYNQAISIISSVPEPAPFALVGGAFLVGLLVARRTLSTARFE